MQPTLQEERRTPAPERELSEQEAIESLQRIFDRLRHTARQAAPAGWIERKAENSPLATRYITR